MTDTNIQIIKEAKRLEEDCQCSSKGHFEASKRWSKCHYGLGIPAAILASFAGISSFSDYPILSGVLAVFSSAFAAIITFLNPSSRASEHLSAGNSYLALRNSSRIFRNIKINAISIEDAVTSLDELSKQRSKLNTSLPQVPESSFKKAQKNILAGQCDYAVDSDK